MLAIFANINDLDQDLHYSPRSLGPVWLMLGTQGLNISNRLKLQCMCVQFYLRKYDIVALNFIPFKYIYCIVIQMAPLKFNIYTQDV